MNSWDCHVITTRPRDVCRRCFDWRCLREALPWQTWRRCTTMTGDKYLGHVSLSTTADICSSAVSTTTCCFVKDLNLNGKRRKESILAIIYDGGVRACYWVFEPQIRRLKSVMVSAWTCNSLSWFQSTIVFTKKIILTLFSVGCRYYETSGVVGR